MRAVSNMIATSDKDYYEIMQVDATAESAVITAAYKALAAKYHPDRNTSTDANRRMQAINEAYEVLSDPHKRADYDRQHPAKHNGHRNGYAASPPPAHMTLTDQRARERFERMAQRIRDLQAKSLQQIQAVQDRSAQQIRDIQDRAAQQVKDVQDRAAQQIREIEHRTAEQIRGIQEAM